MAMAHATDGRRDIAMRQPAIIKWHEFARKAQAEAFALQQAEAVKQQCNTRPARSVQNNSRLLILPSELRNYIWTLAFTDNDRMDDEPIDLVTTKNPSRALLNVCWQIRDEASGIYQTAYAEYWSGHFFLNAHVRCNAYGEGQIIDSALDDEVVIPQIKHLTIQTGDILGRDASLTYNVGVWTGCFDGIQGFQGAPSFAVCFPPNLRGVWNFKIRNYWKKGAYPYWAETRHVFRDLYCKEDAEKTRQKAQSKGLTKGEIIGALLYFRSWA